MMTDSFDTTRTGSSEDPDDTTTILVETFGESYASNIAARESYSPPPFRIPFPDNSAFLLTSTPINDLLYDNDGYAVTPRASHCLSTCTQDMPPASKIWLTDKLLYRFNVAAAILHFLQGLVMLVASQLVDSIKDFSKELTTSFQTFEKDANTLQTETKDVGWAFEIGLAAAVFLLLSAVAHCWVLCTFDAYIDGLSRGINKARWFEYAVSSSVMIVAIAILFGCFDLATLVLIVFLNASMNLFGLLMELLNPLEHGMPRSIPVDWTPFWCGSWAGLGAWVVILMYFLGGGNYSQIPNFVYGILAGYFFFFNTFPVNMALQYSEYGWWEDYRFGELVYVLLSLASKTLLAWLVFGGTFQPNEGDDYVA